MPRTRTPSIVHRFRVLLILLGILLPAIGVVGIAELKTEALAHTAPNYDKINLLPILSKTQYTEEDYHTLYMQTGLGRPAIEDLRLKGDYVERMLSFQENFFAPTRYICERRLVVTCQEFLINEAGRYVKGFELAPLKDGDILITYASHTFGWRNGHAGIVTDADTGRTVEAVSLGVPSCYQNAKDWRNYPTIIVLRVREEMSGQLPLASQAASLAEEHLIGLPYHLTVGFLEPKYQPFNELAGTQCAHLVWLAYRAVGLDLDSDGGQLVTVKDLVHSPILEIVQVFGVNPENIWP